MARLVTQNNDSDSMIRITRLPEWPTRKGRVCFCLSMPRPTKQGAKRAAMNMLQNGRAAATQVGQAPEASGKVTVELEVLLR